MSPAGISMFYGAFKKEAAILETVEPKKQSKPLYTVATFRLKHAIEVIDFSAIPPIPSIFDLRKLAHYQWKIFLQNFVADLTRPINKEDDTVHIDYAPTQVVTEYCRYVLSEKKKKVFSGMIYPSSLYKKTNQLFCFTITRNHWSSSYSTKMHLKPSKLTKFLTRLNLFECSSTLFMKYLAIQQT